MQLLLPGPCGRSDSGIVTDTISSLQWCFLSAQHRAETAGLSSSLGKHVSQKDPEALFPPNHLTSLSMEGYTGALLASLSSKPEVHFYQP